MEPPTRTAMVTGTAMAQILKLMCIHLLMGCTCTLDHVFLETPAPLNVTVGSVANFNCRVNTTVSTVFFQINGTSVTMLNDGNVSAVLRSEGLTTLHINANVEYNNTVIECVAIFLDEGNFFTDPVPLMVQGPLAAPSNLNVTNRIGPIPQPVVLRWAAPFSLDITGVDPDISNYTVFTTNLNTSRNGSMTISETEFEFINLMGEDLNPCYNYSFTVIAINLAGEGNSSEPVMGNIRIAPQAVPADRVDVTLTLNVQNTRWTICMDCELALPDCPGTEPEMFMMHVTNDDGSVRCVHSDMTAEPIGGGRLRICFTEDVRNLILDEFYSARIFAINSAGNTSSNGLVEFTTFDLQNVIIHLNGTVVCQYIGGSVAQGCLVIARQNDKIVYGIFRVQEDARNFTFATESGGVAYKILGFDLEQNGTFGTQAAVSQRNATMIGILLQDFDNSAVSEATVLPEDGGIVCANCSFVMGSDATGCVIILHALENVQQLLSHTISRDGSGTFAQGCFPVFSSGNFSLAIFAVGSNGPQGITPAHVQNITILEAATTPSSTPTVQPSDSNAPIIAGAIIAVIVVITVIIVMAVHLVCCCRRHTVKLSSKIVFAETNVQMTSEVAQGSPTSIDSYHRTDESHRVMADSDSPTRDGTQNRSRSGSSEPPEIPPQNFDIKDDENASGTQQHGIANSQYYLLQAAGDTEAPPPAYDTVVSEPSNTHTTQDIASGGFYDVVRDPNAKPKHYVQLNTTLSDQPLPQPPQELRVKYDQIVSREPQREMQISSTGSEQGNSLEGAYDVIHHAEHKPLEPAADLPSQEGSIQELERGTQSVSKQEDTTEGAVDVSDPSTKPVKHYAQLKPFPSDLPPPPPSQEVPVQYAQIAQLQSEVQSTKTDSTQKDAIFDKHSETRPIVEQGLPPPIPPREGRDDTPPTQPP